MRYDYRVALVVILVGAAVVYGIFSVPPLTSGGNLGGSGGNKEKFDAAVSQELAYCREQPNSTNCQCFANKSGMILTHEQPRVSGAIYADKRSLAREQAAQGC